jgi:hypothetical protein
MNRDRPTVDSIGSYSKMLDCGTVCRESKMVTLARGVIW